MLHRAACAFLVLVCLVLALTSSAAPRAAPDVTISLRPDDGVLMARWTLSGPVETFAFSGFEAERRSRLEDWRFDAEAWRFDGVTLSRQDGAVFSGFSAQVRPATTLRYRGYAAASRIGPAGWVIHAGAFAPRAPSSFGLAIEGLPASSIMLTDRSATPASVFRSDIGREFVYFGPADQVSDDEVRIVRSRGTAIDALYAAFQVGLDQSLEVLADRLGGAPPRRPVVSLSYDENQPREGLKGSVDGAFIALTVHGHSPERFATLATGPLTQLIVHEAFHLWNGLERSGGEPAPTWLVEGGAEYVAERLAYPGDALPARLETQINRCLLAVGPASIAESGIARMGRTPYACGALVMVFTEAGQIRVGGGDILDVWREILEEPGYDKAEFLAAVEGLADTRSRVAVEQVLDGWTAAETAQKLAYLTQAGIHLEPFTQGQPETPDLALSVDVLRAVAREACLSGFGVEAGPEQLQLTSEAGCGLLPPGAFAVQRINGVHILLQPRGAFMAARDACLQGGSVVLDNGGESAAPARIDCPAALLEHPGLFTVNSLGALEGLARTQ